MFQGIDERVQVTISSGRGIKKLKQGSVPWLFDFKKTVEPKRNPNSRKFLQNDTVEEDPSDIAGKSLSKQTIDFEIQEDSVAKEQDIFIKEQDIQKLRKQNNELRLLGKIWKKKTRY